MEKDRFADIRIEKHLTGKALQVFNNKCVNNNVEINGIVYPCQYFGVIHKYKGDDIDFAANNKKVANIFQFLVDREFIDHATLSVVDMIITSEDERDGTLINSDGTVAPISPYDKDKKRITPTEFIIKIRMYLIYALPHDRFMLKSNEGEVISSPWQDIRLRMNDELNLELNIGETDMPRVRTLDIFDEDIRAAKAKRLAEIKSHEGCPFNYCDSSPKCEGKCRYT